MTRLVGAALAVLLGFALTSCGADTPPALQGVPGGDAESAPASPPPVADPTAISIPVIGARSSLIPLGLTETGELAVPPVDNPMQASWYAGAKPDEPGDEFAPGENGPAIIAGHVDGVIDGRKGRPGIFYRLYDLGPGDEVFIDQADGGQLRFVVDRVEKYAKAAFPSDEVYGPTRGPELRLITCGGSFDRVAGHYVDNVVVYASLAPEQL